MPRASVRLADNRAFGAGAKGRTGGRRAGNQSRGAGKAIAAARAWSNGGADCEFDSRVQLNLEPNQSIWAGNGGQGGAGIERSLAAKQLILHNQRKKFSRISEPVTEEVE